jgi:hypothetical protein
MQFNLFAGREGECNGQISPKLNAPYIDYVDNRIKTDLFSSSYLGREFRVRTSPIFLSHLHHKRP